MDDAAIGKFSFGNDNELFDTTLKYASWRTPKSTKIFEANIFVIRKALLKFMKTASQNLEPYSIISHH